MSIISHKKLLATAALTLSSLSVVAWFVLDFAWFKFYDMHKIALFDHKQEFVNAIVGDASTTNKFDIVELDILNDQVVVMTSAELCIAAVIGCTLLCMSNLFALYVTKMQTTTKQLDVCKQFKVLSSKQTFAACIVWLACYALLTMLSGWQWSLLWLFANICLIVLIESIGLLMVNKQNKFSH